MTRIEAEQDLRKVTRRCRGHWLLNEMDRNVLRAKFNLIRDKHNWKDATSFKHSLEKVLNLGHEHIERDNWDHMFTRVAGIIFGCKEDCGYDINDLICQFPFDGVEREVACPKCGTTQIFSVLYDLT